jgi:arylformamidase
MRPAAWLLLGALFHAGLAAAAPQDNSIAAARNDLQVRVERDLAYGSDRRQRLDAYLPARPKGAVLLLVHGGAWHAGDKASPNFLLAKVRHWTARGYVVVSTNYRMLPEADPLQQALDVARALAFVQARAPGWGADPRQVVLLGHSSGAHLVMILNASPALARREGAQPWRGAVSLDNPVVDATAMMRRHYDFYEPALGRDPQFWPQVSPMDLLAADAPPLLAVCSRRSGTCPGAEALQRKARSMGRVVEVQAVDMTHNALGERLGLPGAYTDSVARWISSIL